MPECVHHWLIESPNGSRLVAGRCKKCGAAREFPAANEALYLTMTERHGSWASIPIKAREIGRVYE